MAAKNRAAGVVKRLKGTYRYVKTIGCVMVTVRNEGIITRLVYIGENQGADVADENTARALPAQ